MKYQLKKDIIIPKGTVFDADALTLRPPLGAYQLDVGGAWVVVGKAVDARVGVLFSSSNKSELNKWVKPIA